MKIIKITLSFSLFIFTLMANSNSLLSDYKRNINANKDIQLPKRVKMKSLYCFDSDKKDYVFEAANYGGRLYKSTKGETSYGGIVNGELFDKTRSKFNLYGDTDYFVYEVLSGIKSISKIKDSIEIKRHNSLFGITTKRIQGFCSDCPENIREDVYDFSRSANYLTRYPKFTPGNRNRTCKVRNNYFYIFNHFHSKNFEPSESVDEVSKKVLDEKFEAYINSL